MAVVEKRLEQYTKVSTSDKNEKSQEQDIPAHSGWGIRHFQLIIFTIILCMSFIARTHMGVTMVAMTRERRHSITNTDTNTTRNLTDVTDTNYTGVNETGLNRGNVTIKKHDEEWTIYRTYEWDKPIQEMVLNAFFLGYALMMFPMGLVCQRWGGKLPLQISMLINGIVSFITPWLALWGDWKAVCACRVVQGFTQAGTYPSIQVLLAKWVPAGEKATLSSYLYTGTTVGTVIGFQISGVLSDLGGWPCTYWVVGIMCIMCFVFLTFLGTASPMDHNTISEQERNFIRGSIRNTSDIQRRKTPWKAMLTSKPMWANFATHIGSGAAINFFSAQVPSYIHYILSINVKNSGLLSSLPYVVSLFPSLGFGVASDYFTNNNIVSVKNIRRICNSVSQVGLAASLIGASFATSTTLCVICFVITISCHTGIHAGWMVNHIDLAPNYSGTMMSMGNTMANTVVILLPVVVSYVVTDVTNVFQWRIMLSLVAGMCFFTNIVFVLFLSTDVQPWNEGLLEEDDIEKDSLEKSDKETNKL